MVNYSCAKKVQDSTKLRLLKGQKTKFPQGSMPPDFPTLPHALHTDTYLPPPIIHTISFGPPPLGKKLKETLYNLFGVPTHLFIVHNIHPL